MIRTLDAIRVGESRPHHPAKTRSLPSPDIKISVAENVDRTSPSSNNKSDRFLVEILLQGSTCTSYSNLKASENS